MPVPRLTRLAPHTYCLVRVLDSYPHLLCVGRTASQLRVSRTLHTSTCCTRSFATLSRQSCLDTLSASSLELGGRCCRAESTGMRPIGHAASVGPGADQAKDALAALPDTHWPTTWQSALRAETEVLLQARQGAGRPAEPASA